MWEIGCRGSRWLFNGGSGRAGREHHTAWGLFVVITLYWDRIINHWMMNQVKTQEVKIGRSQIIAEVEVSENLTMDSDSYDELQLGAASDSWFSFLSPVPLLKYSRGGGCCSPLETTPYIYIFKLLLWYHSRCNFNDVHYLKYTLYYTLWKVSEPVVPL